MGLKFLHDHGIIHRSLTAKCVGIDENYDVKIRDWGRATYVDPVPEENEE